MLSSQNSQFAIASGNGRQDPSPQSTSVVTIGSNPSASKGNIPELLTARELEALLRIDVKTIYSYVQRGLIPYVRIQSNLRFVRSQILDWIAAHNYRTEPALTRRFRR
jgi:predicted DNA-binding transcriptional regulator AlpA